MNIDFNEVLVLAPHTDDGEIGCGGTISKLISEGKKVHYLAFSSAKKSLREQGRSEDTLVKEVKRATSVLGISDNNLYIYDINVREFDKYRQDIIDILIEHRNKINPVLVFAPSINDIHQDHEVVSREALRAFKNITILGYEMPWNNIEFQTRAFIKLDEEFLNQKIKALKCYKSQSHRRYLNGDFIYSLAKMRGVQIESNLAEAFEVMRLVI